MTLRGFSSALVTGSLALAMLAAPSPASGQPTGEPGRIEFDRPEAWAMKYFTSASLLLPPLPESQRAPIDVGLDIVWLPPLSTAQQRVGFNGTAVEDLNQAPVFLRPRVTMALGDRWTVTAAGLPPVRLFGVTPRLLALGVGWRAWRTERWTLSAFAHGQTGTVTGAITCPADVLRFAPGSDGNPTGCEQTSADVTTLRYAAVELDVDRSLTRSGRWAARGSFGASLIDGAFQTNAHTFGFLDRTRLASRGVAYSGSVGLSYVRDRIGLGADLVYAPLSIRRPSEASSSLDGLLTLRSVVTYRIH